MNKKILILDLFFISNKPWQNNNKKHDTKYIEDIYNEETILY
jgi:hypothetical protein